jgi:hypothetical protein
MNRASKGPSARRSTLVGAALLLSLVVLPPASAAPPAGYVTILFGRTQFTTVGSDCQPLANTVDLDQVASDLASRRLSAVGAVVVDRTSESGFSCWGGFALQPDWRWIRHRYRHGWRFVSAGLGYRDMTMLSPREARKESCGSLPAFTAHGIAGASGLFAYPGNHYTPELQTEPVARCFAFGRRYDTIDHPNIRKAAGPPWFAKTYSVNGGLCNDPTAFCSTATGTVTTPTTRYASPEALSTAVEAAPGTWFIPQFYRFVTGTYANRSVAWDCSSTDWRQHYSSKSELYCYGDFLSVMDAIETATTTGVVVADPASVAEAWGR